MITNFDKIVNRRQTNSVKADSLVKHFGREDLIPLWVADMDFESPECVKEALQNILDGGIYGYNTIPQEYFPTLVCWLDRIQHWKVESEWITFIPGIVKGIGYVIEYFTKPGDGVIVQPPVYPPFMSVPKWNDRNVVYNPLIKITYPNSQSIPGCPAYKMDFENLEQVAATGNCKVLILSNPHNPGGVVWDKQTLARLASVCHKYGILVIADEIHADMPLFGESHIPFASVSEQAAEISITFGAPSKTFNIAGIVSSYAVVPNEKIRTPFYKWLTTNELNSPTIFATSAAVAAYSKGNDWRLEMIEYIEKNVLFTEAFFRSLVADEKQLIVPIRPQASFLIWLDCRPLCKHFGFNQEQLVDLFVNKAKLALNDGSTFGPGGEGFMRLNIGSPQAVLNKAFTQLAQQIALL